MYYIGGGDGLAAVYVKQSGQSDKIYYAHNDHLGSILSLTDNNGASVFKATYDAWGRQTVSQNTIGFARGYTGHEHLPEFGLIDMNGRMYDPLLGRFLSPDNYVQLPDFSQNYNRYTYCLNNPLIYTDPSGELIGELIYIAAMAYFGGVQANFMHAANTGGNPFNPGDWNWKSPWTYIGMASSGLGAYSQIGGLNGFATDALNPSKLFNIPKDPNFLAFATDGGPGKVRLLQNGLYEAQYSLNPVYVYGRDLSKVAAITQKIHQGQLAFLNHPVTKTAIHGLVFVATGGIEGTASLYTAGRSLLTRGAGLAAKPALTNAELVQSVATRAENAIGGTGRFAGTAKHTYATNLLERYQSIYGSRGLEVNKFFNNGVGNRGFLDVLDNANGIIYDFKFGNAVMSRAQYTKYWNNFGLPIQIIKP